MKMPETLQRRWNSLLPREKTLVQVTAAVIGVALLWWLAVAPALQTLRTANTRHQALDTQLQQMKRLQAQAQQLQTQPKIGADESLRALEAAVKQRLGTGGQLNVAGDRATVTLKAVPAGPSPPGWPRCAPMPARCRSKPAWCAAPRRWPQNPVRQAPHPPHAGTARWC